VVGGEQAEQFALEHGEPPERATIIGSAEGGHLTAGQDQDLSHSGGLVSAGAFLDVTGTRIDELDAQSVEKLSNPLSAIRVTTSNVAHARTCQRKRQQCRPVAPVT
jgi:hypothetical protein